MSIDTARPGNYFAALSASGDATIIPAPTAPAFIRIFSLNATFSGASTVVVESGSTTIATLYGTAGGPVNMVDEKGLFDCVPGDAFKMNPSAGNVGVFGRYGIFGAS